MLQKTMWYWRGSARSLHPALDMWRTAEPVVRDWMTAELSPSGTLARAQDALTTLASAALEAPALTARKYRLIPDLGIALVVRGVPLDPDTVTRLGKFARGRSLVRDAALWVGAGALAVIAWGMTG